MLFHKGPPPPIRATVPPTEDHDPIPVEYTQHIMPNGISHLYQFDELILPHRITALCP